jgi:hypothetical protein
MSDKFSNKFAKKQGNSRIEQWMKVHCNLDIQTSLNKGSTIVCKDLTGIEKNLPLNRTGILFEDCSMIREGTDSNHGTGGSNCVTGTPVAFVDLITVFPEVFSNSRVGILTSCKQPCFILPLCQINEAPDMTNIMVEAYTEFVAQRKGDTAHDNTHVANGICSGLAAICFSLCQEITFNGKKPDAERMKFLVEAFYTLALTAHSVAKHFTDCDKIFRLVPYVATTTDTFQSTIMSFIFDESPCESIRVKHVGSSILRYFTNNSWSSSYITTNPVGLIGLLLVAPMLCGMLTTDLETKQLINKIVRAINDAITSITLEVGKNSNFGIQNIHDQNKTILRGFSKATKVPIVSVDQIDKIYDAVRNHQRDIATTIGVAKHAPFVKDSTKYTLNSRNADNYSVMIDESANSATYIPAEPREWTGVTLLPGSEYIVEATTLGISNFKSGKTFGEQNIANFRFTSGFELMKGLYPGYSATGMYFDPKTQRFIEAKNHDNIDPNKPFTVTSCINGIIVRQTNKDVLHIPNNGDLDVSPTICFKYCKIKITLVRKLPLCVSSILTERENKAAKDKIVTCMSLTESLSGLHVTGSARMDIRARQKWGQSTANKLCELNQLK